MRHWGVEDTVRAAALLALQDWASNYYLRVVPFEGLLNSDEGAFCKLAAKLAQESHEDRLGVMPLLKPPVLVACLTVLSYFKEMGVPGVRDYAYAGLVPFADAKLAADEQALAAGRPIRENPFETLISNCAISQDLAVQDVASQFDLRSKFPPDEALNMAPPPYTLLDVGPWREPSLDEERQASNDFWHEVEEDEDDSTPMSNLE
jgi:hypothetical protein